MRYKQLGATGMKVSVLGFGGIPVQRVSSAQAAAVLAACREHGVNFIDTARMYTDSEEKIGRFLKGENRDYWYVATKSTARDYQGMRKDIHISLQQLQCQYIDLYQLHNVANPADVEKILGPDGALKALTQACQQGYVRHIGITGHKSDVLGPAVETGLFATVQLPYNALEIQTEPLLRQAHDRLNMGTIAMKPLAGGALTAAAAALDFCLQSDFLDVTIPGMDTVEQVEANSATVSGQVSDSQRRELERLVASLGNRFCRRCEYCQPCPTGLNIPALFLFEGYYSRYDLKQWALERYDSLAKKASDCTGCGVCESRCPYDLPIREMLAQTAAALEKNCATESGERQ